MAEIKFANEEIKIKKLIEENKLNKEIAAILGTSEKTVDTHIKHMHLKTDTHNKVELAMFKEYDTE